MTGDLQGFVARELSAAQPLPIRSFAERLARQAGAEAVLFYGSVLRTGDLEGVLDFYLLTPGSPGAGWVARRLWPEVSYHEAEVEGRTLRAKVATMPTEVFIRAAGGDFLDTTIWTRFVQPAALVFVSGEQVAQRVRDGVCAAAKTAARYAAALGPARGPAETFWLTLFRHTYKAELRVERPGREREIIGFDPERYATLLPLAWAAAGVGHDAAEGGLRPCLPVAERVGLRRAWSRREAAGKPLNALRLVKAASTFEGAARYAAWKIERHSGVVVPLSPLKERYPLLAAPNALWRLWRARRGGPR